MQLFFTLYILYFLIVEIQISAR